MTAGTVRLRRALRAAGFCGRFLLATGGATRPALPGAGRGMGTPTRGGGLDGDGGGECRARAGATEATDWDARRTRRASSGSTRTSSGLMGSAGGATVRSLVTTARLGLLLMRSARVVVMVVHFDESAASPAAAQVLAPPAAERGRRCSVERSGSYTEDRAVRGRLEWGSWGSGIRERR
jgi:hypothetical protein